MSGKDCFKTLALTTGRLKDTDLFIYYYSVTAVVIYSMKMAAFKSINFFGIIIQRDVMAKTAWLRMVCPNAKATNILIFHTFLC